MRRTVAAAAIAAATLLIAQPAWAPFHLLVIEEMFFGTADQPRAQYVQMRTISGGQTFFSLQSQPVDVQEADGSPFDTFGTIAENLPNTSNAAAVLIGTREAEDLFCVDMDAVAEGDLVFPDGRICFGRGGLDCVAYGDFTGSNGNHGDPAVRPELGQALARVSETDNNAADFVTQDPSPVNNAGVAGRSDVLLDGIPGDADGGGAVDAGDVDAGARVLFIARRRCDLAEEQRGADANLDTRVNAADVTATIGAVLAG